MYLWANSRQSTVLRLSDGASIPIDEANADYAEVRRWVAAGHTIAAYETPAPTADDVRAEAQRRIIALTGATDLNGCLVRQMNALMRGTEIANKRAMGLELTPGEIAEAGALQAMADAIKAIRAASNMLEAEPPTDYADDGYWS